MKMHSIHIRGYFEQQDDETAEELQVLAPDNELDESLLSWAILPHAQTVTDESARRDYTFRYEIGDQIDDGMFRLAIHCTDASGAEHAAEIAAALAITQPMETDRARTFVPMWLMSKQIHFQPLGEGSDVSYHAPAYGRLVFGSSENLPHRRLFGATV